MKYKLTIELVPKTAWYTNVRSNVTNDEWDIIRKKCYKEAGNKCEICGDIGKNQGVKHNVECHEIWNYNDEEMIQTLTGLIALCPNCHKCKHIGLAEIKGELNLAIKHLMNVNNISNKDTVHQVENAMLTWKMRSQYEWELDISYLDIYKLSDDDKFLSMFNG